MSVKPTKQESGFSIDEAEMALAAESADSSVAIIAMTGQFPGAGNIDEFWYNLRNGAESISRFSRSDFGHGGPPSAVTTEPNFVMAHGVLRDIELFDHQFFNYSPAEAQLIDPQQRLFLEQASAVLEIAGYNPDTYPGLIGVYAGVATNTYLYNNIYPNDPSPDSTRQFQIMVANDKDYLSTRVSYKLNLKGPSYTIQTACSTSLVAVHAACQSLLTGECDIALAGGVSVKVPQVSGYLYEEGMIFSKDGHVRPFDARATGTVWGNGVGIVVLKPLAAALRDGDTIHAIIRGSATNNDGSLKASYAAPGKEGQARAILEAQSLAGVNAESITYVEAHGTGTLLGDPVEVAALSQAFRKGTAATGFCSIGSVKSNVGHLDSAAGIAGLIKTALMLKHGELVPTINFETANPNIDFSNSPFYVSNRLAPWEAGSGPRRAGVTSLGVGGTNVHVIMEEPPARRCSAASCRPPLLVLSAKTSAALEQIEQNLRDHLRTDPGINLSDVAYTLAVGRREYAHRRVIVLRPPAREERSLERILDVSGKIMEAAPSVVFVFPRLTPAKRHFPEARILFDSQPFFREHVQQCQGLLREGRLPDPFAPLAGLNSDRNDLLSAFILLYALARFWMSAGIRPVTVTGQGLGELVAAVIAGALSLQQALQVLDLEGSQDSVVGVDASVGSIDIPSSRWHVTAGSPTTPLASCVTGSWATAEGLSSSQHWADVATRERGAGGAFPRSMLAQHTNDTLLCMGSRDDFQELPPSDGIDTRNCLMAVLDPTAPAQSVVVCIARLWAMGAAVDWTRYYRGEQRRRVALPTYPFSRSRHWLDIPAVDSVPRISPVHPFLHRNVSSFQRLRFSSRFTGRELFFREHGGERVMPGVVCLEMARAAVGIATERSADETKRMVVKNVAWMNTVKADQQDREVFIELRESGNGAIEYVIGSHTSVDPEQETLHSKGLVEAVALQTPAPLDVEILSATASARRIEQAQFYSRFAAHGLIYEGPHRGVRSIQTGESHVLAQIGPTNAEAHGLPPLGLHPTILDAAVQAAAAMDWDGAADAVPRSEPLGLDELQVYTPSVNAVYAWVRHSQQAVASNSGPDVQKPRKFDIDLCEPDGTVCIRMTGFRAMTPGRVISRTIAAIPDVNGYIPVWNPRPGAAKTRPSTSDRRVLAIGAPIHRQALLQHVFPAARFISLGASESTRAVTEELGREEFDHLLWIAPEPAAKSVDDEGLLCDQQAGVVQVFRTIKALLSLGYASRDLEYTLVTRCAQQVLREDRVEPSHAGVHGLAGSLAKEYEHWKIRLLDLDSCEAWPVEQMFGDTASEGNTLAYRNGEWFSQQLVPAAGSLPAGQSDYRMGGVYVLIGGAGGVGEVFSRYLAEKYLANVVWVGRRELDESIRSKIRSFPKWAPAPHYITADATEYASLARARAEIKQRFGIIDGVIHCAIALLDRSLANMEEHDLLACLSAKVDVSVRIAQVFGAEQPDLILFFSSIQSFSRSPGTANYAAACTFKDAFARRLSRDWGCTVKTVNWGFWGATGVLDTAQYREWMAKSGVRSIKAEDGMAALTGLMRSTVPQLAYDKGYRPELLRLVSAEELYRAYPPDVPSVITTLQQMG